MVLFGSYASGRFTAASDVDLLVVHQGAPRDEAYATVRKILDLSHLEPHVYTLEAYRAAKTTVQRMERGGVVLFEA